MIATTLSVILFLAATYGGEIQAHNLVFRSPQACAAFVSTLERATIRHTIIRPCDSRTLMWTT